MSDIPHVLAPHLASMSGLAHGFFGRRGGVSKGLYDSLNVGIGSDDNKKDVMRNRVLVSGQLGARTVDHLLSCYQIHSSIVHTVTEPGYDRPEGDAMVTKEPGLALCIVTADCVPVLFADRKAGVIGAAHAGWKGALGGVLEATLDAMEKLGAHRKDIHAAIGPCIGQDSYEVGPEFREQFIAEAPWSDKLFAPATATASTLPSRPSSRTVW